MSHIAIANVPKGNLRTPEWTRFDRNIREVATSLCWNFLFWIRRTGGLEDWTGGLEDWQLLCRGTTEFADGPIVLKVTPTRNMGPS